MSMDEVTPGLWIGDLASALDVENLRARGIYSILSAMRGRLTIKETFIRHQVLLDDTEDADILEHLLPSIHFIQAELDKGRGVLVHCQAGVSRSATIVAAYLMSSKNLDTESALQAIKEVRPIIEPNENFLRQLEIFHQAHHKISKRDKPTRMYYMHRALEEVMNGDGSPPETNMFAKYPPTPSDSVPNTPGYPRRRIRCKMCRHELATREHMLDHGQLGPATPATRSPAVSRRPSMTARSTRSSMSQNRPNVETIRENGEATTHRTPFRGIGDGLTMSPLTTETNVKAEAANWPNQPLGNEKSTLSHLSNGLHPVDSSESTSALESDDDEKSDPKSQSDPVVTPGIAAMTARILGRRLSNAVMSPVMELKTPGFEVPAPLRPDEPSLPLSETESLMTTHIDPLDLVRELNSNPKLATMQNPFFPPGMGMTGMKPNIKTSNPVSGPILANSKCSGYFVEPMKWMEPFLASGQIAGKIVCPNSKCGVKLGNYDWAGVCCGCKAWVTPGFCINRSKVDEIVK